ncbi:hypothetical protein COY26_02885 [Candidatus Woesearchaeota archaeon CG_4_10_14_0_2_um_filter_33_10]|nr:MAG: hypothetical protein AUJ83_00380 [Candidatus Woesearchaeota archaeon CG1_02_33_12]PIN78525.1 MAG: hypothetical protein COV14_03190 [Candidatus Woesearchaeota archaeon CG10_big_fil_rev_8_21_14_0_10_33_12]PIU73086.1 MAG: hypothetical protein COS79_00230 [Candidatus Woesearchaeota archaeon CG06_land_8_20_14_3_00_33_13]PIZ53046.1 MAG: hypothetical protein COY26_02885 [Candidatus Woesearchaeota archaeon CG_4_10_14_0_2_um_filter_33_10]
MDEMKKYLSEEDQLKNVEKFNDILKENPKGLNLSLFGLFIGMDLKLIDAGKDKITGEPLEKTHIYKTYLPIFKDIVRKKLDIFTIAEPLGINKEDLLKIKEKQDKGEKIEPGYIWKAFGLDKNNIPDFNDSSSFREETFKQLTKKITPEVNKKLNEKIGIDPQRINQVLNAIEKYREINEKKEKLDIKLKEYISLRLYSDAMEIYLKILEEYYRLLTGTPFKDIKNNKEIYDYFQKEFPLLWDSPYNKLRNDICHCTYEERDKYTLDQVDETRTVILLKALTAIMARNYVLVEIFQKAIFSNKDFFNNMLDNSL